MADGQGLVHGYGTRQIMGAFWDVNKQKAERNREITNILINQATQGRLADFKEGSPVYRGMKNQYGEQFARGLVTQSNQAKATREAAAVKAKRNQMIADFSQGNFIYDTTMKLLESEVDTEKLRPVAEKYLAQAEQFLAKAGITVDLNPQYDSAVLKKNYNDALLKTMFDNLKKYENGAIKLDDLKIAKTLFASTGLSAKGSKELLASVDKIIANAEKVKAAEVATQGRKTAADLTNERRKTAADLANERRVKAAKLKASQEKGLLTDEAVLKDIRELVNYDPEQAKLWSGKYTKYRKAGKSRWDALQKVKEDYHRSPSGKDYSHFWK